MSLKNISTSDLLPVSNKQMPLTPMYVDASAFAKKEAKTFGQLLLLWEKWIMADRK